MKRRQTLIGLSFLIAFFAQLPSSLQASQTPSQARGLIIADYQYFPLERTESIDLLGLHYLHQLNDWFYLGAGLHAPLLQGNYGGFMTYDASVHISQQLWGAVYLDLSGSLGGGGGGSSILQSQVLSGNGGFSKAYAGLTWRFPRWHLGLGYSKFQFFRSSIDDERLIIYLQKPVAFQVLPYLNDSAVAAMGWAERSGRRTRLTVEFNNILQINPQGAYQDPIHSLHFQFSQYLNESLFGFIGGEGGVAGLRLYNQVLGGLGYQKALSDKLSLIAQLGVGSGGYAPEEIDTGSGLLVNPKLALEYPVGEQTALALTTGYLFAPDGTSRNATVGLALSYYLRGGKAGRDEAAGMPQTQPFRVHLYHQDKLALKVNDQDHDDIHMVTTQMDYLLGDHWYLPMQLSLATNDYLDFPGYGEILLGLGAQSKASPSSRWQWYAQLTAGPRLGGIIAKPQLGLNYRLSPHYAVYAQAGMSRSLSFATDSSMRSFDLGLGLSYRFSLFR